MAKRDNKYPAKSRDKEQKQGDGERSGRRQDGNYKKESGGKGQSGLRSQKQSGTRPKVQPGVRPKRESRPERELQPKYEPQAEERYNDADGENRNLVIGRNPVTEALKSGRQIDRLCIQKDIEGSGKMIAALAREKKVVIQYVDKQALDRMASSGAHQGVAAYVSPYEYCEVEDILKAAKDKGEAPLVVLLDGLEDPHNLGAIMRTAEAAGAHGIIIPARRSVSLTETVAKASAGAIEYMPVAKVANIVQTMEQLKKEGLWIAVCDMGGQDYYDADVTGPLGIVIGGEGQGVSRLVREKSDFVVSVPMSGQITSLNASNAAAVLLYEVYRQRRKGKRQEPV